MKRIGILSDTHSCYDPRFAVHFADCDEIWHAGDIGDISVIDRLQADCPNAIIRAVVGNIDPAPMRRLFPEVLTFDIEGLKVWMTHIAGYPGHYAPGVAKILRNEGIGLMVAGHSHILKIIPDPNLNLLHINPGAAGTHGWQRERTLVRITIADGCPREAEVITLSKKRQNS